MQMDTQSIVMLLTQPQLIAKILPQDVLHNILSMLVKQMLMLPQENLGLMVQMLVLKGTKFTFNLEVPHAATTGTVSQKALIITEEVDGTLKRIKFQSAKIDPVSKLLEIEFKTEKIFNASGSDLSDCRQIVHLVYKLHAKEVVLVTLDMITVN